MLRILFYPSITADFHRHACLWKSNTFTHTCIQLMRTHTLTRTYVSSCSLQSFPGVCFTRHLCCLPGVFRVMLCAESSHVSALHGLRWPGVAGCGYACWVRLTTTWWITSQLHPKRHIHTQADPPDLSTVQSGPGKRNNCPLPSLCMEINFNKPTELSTAVQSAGKAENPPRSKGEEGESWAAALRCQGLSSSLSVICALGQVRFMSHR